MIIYIILTLIFFVWITYNKSTQKWKSLSTVPGPKGVPILGNILDLSADPKKSMDLFYDMTNKYGGIFKLKLSDFGYILMISDPKYMEIVLTSSVHVYKGGFYKFLKAWLGNGLVCANDSKWKNARKLITPIFNTKLMDGFCKHFDKRNREFMSELKELEGKPLDIEHLIARNSFLNMFRCLISDDVSEEVVAEYQVSSNKAFTCCMDRFFSINIFDFVFNLSKDKQILLEAVENTRNITRNLIKKRRRERAENSDSKHNRTFLDTLLDIQDANEDMPDLDIVQQVDTFMFGGHETVSTTLNFAMYELSCNREIQEKILEEMNLILGNDLLTELSMKDLDKAEYLGMFCNEAMRKYAAAPMIQRTTREPLKLGEWEVPIGTTVSLMIYHMHLSEKYYPDPMKFDPDRFLPINKKSRPNMAFVPFSYGPRSCIGQRFAMLVMKSTIAMLVRHFIFSKGHPEFEVKVGQRGSLICLNGIHVQFESRNA